ncbi:energy transducer TonB [Hymenobacter sp. BT635]|uniref:Energy transducer TonB n=1 Tax=Hymenobacter nitidus TaxID=2880929 RepID=A0ABS8A7M8_9BACT|nr:energy transducer TonB [Hymenobacter nitidus]MCB2376390.1 energy transducer TonB [Hymenobacter nitidus]
MRNPYFLPLAALLTLLPLLGFGQQTRPVNRKLANGWNREEYSVLESDPTIKHGPYRMYQGGSSETLAVDGYYTNGQKDSLWTVYNRWSSKPEVRSRGRYRQGQKVGVWEYFGAKQELEQRYDHTQRQLLQHKANEKARITFKPVGTTAALDQEAVYIGGATAVMDFIGSTVKYPIDALRNQQSGTVRIAFIIAADGTVSDYRVAHPAAASMTEESLRVIKLLPATWVPAQAAGQPVASECEIGVVFMMK